MPKLSELTKQLKEFALNPAISDEEFLNAFLFPFVIAGNITNKNHEEFHLDKSRTSEIMNQKADVPVKLRKALSIFGIEEKTIEGMVSFLEDYIDLNRQMVLLEAFTTLAKIEGVFPDNNSDSNDAQEELAIILTALLLKAVSESNLAKADIVLIWKHGLNSIDVQTGDLFHFGFDNRHKKKNIVVIPVNTAFDTHVTRRFEGETFPLVSENTVHGQWLVRLEETGEKLDRIDERIADSLKRAGFCPIKESKAGNGKKDCYPVGSVSIIETSNAVYFLMAMAEFDDFNNARSSSNDIDSAITSLLNMYDRFGLGYDLYLPLMGTGLSRAGLSMQEAYDLLIGSLRKNSNRIHGQVHLILRPADRDEIKSLED